MRKYRDSLLPNLFGDYADYGSVDPLFASAPPADLDALPDDSPCQDCGRPTQGLAFCDSCLDARTRAREENR